VTRFETEIGSLSDCDGDMAMIARDAPVERFVADRVKLASVRSRSLRSANVYLDANPPFKRSVFSNLRLSFTCISAHEKFLVGVALAIAIFMLTSIA
jgi:hypothetical protein